MTFTTTASATPSAGTPAYVPAHARIPARLARLMLTREERLDELADLIDWLASTHAHASSPDWERVIVLDDRLAAVLDAREQVPA